LGFDSTAAIIVIAFIVCMLGTADLYALMAFQPLLFGLLGMLPMLTLPKLLAFE
jgi:hypothetical protein